VLLDEPTAALGVAQTEQVLALIGRLREQGLGVVVISHNLANVFDVVDRIFVLRLGRKAGIYEVGETSREEIVGAITGAEFGRHPSPLLPRPPPRLRAQRRAGASRS
jgi:D-xylose transport system ATP-binding protein